MIVLAGEESIICNEGWCGDDELSSLDLWGKRCVQKY
jgi:hypothetical protein